MDDEKEKLFKKLQAEINQSIADMDYDRAESKLFSKESLI